MSKLLQISHLSVNLRRTGDAIVKDIGFSLREGESLILLGQSGSGKTMTCHAVMGLLEPRRFAVSGSVLFEGTDLFTCGLRERRQVYGGRIAMIPQNPMTAFDPSMKIGRQMMETLLLHTGLSRKEAGDRLKQAFCVAGLVGPDTVCESYPYMLSGGMLQRVMIAFALMVDAKLIIADEPTTALDVAHRNSIVEEFRKLRTAGAGVLLVTHDFAVAAQFGGNILVMKDGDAIERGTVKSVLENPSHPYTKELLNAARLCGADDKGRRIIHAGSKECVQNI